MTACHAALCLYEPIRFYSSFYFSPLKLYDYMAGGLPVIAEDVGQVGRVIRRYRSGIFTDGSVEDLVARIEYLRHQPEAAQAMGSRGRQAVLQIHNWAHVAERIERFLLRLPLR